MPLPANTIRTSIALTALSFMVAVPALAQDLPAPFALPWSDEAPRVAGAEVRAAAVGLPDERIGRFSARRGSARTAGRARALEALHGWADDALARARATPREATRVHAAIDAHARVAAVRPLVDAGAVIVLVVPRGRLREACARRGLPW